MRMPWNDLSLDVKAGLASSAFEYYSEERVQEIGQNYTLVNTWINSYNKNWFRKRNEMLDERINSLSVQEVLKLSKNFFDKYVDETSSQNMEAYLTKEQTEKIKRYVAIPEVYPAESAIFFTFQAKLYKHALAEKDAELQKLRSIVPLEMPFRKQNQQTASRFYVDVAAAK